MLRLHRADSIVDIKQMLTTFRDLPGVTTPFQAQWASVRMNSCTNEILRSDLFSMAYDIKMLYNVAILLYNIQHITKHDIMFNKRL